MARQKRMRGFRLRGGVWHIRTDPLKGKPMSTGCRDTDSALAWRAQREKLAASPSHVAAQTERLGPWLARFLENKRAAARSGTLSEKTVEYWEGKLGQLSRVIGDDISIADITTEVVDNYVATRRSDPARGEDFVRDCTINRELRALVGALKLAKRANRCPIDLDALIPTDLGKAGKPRQRWLPESEVDALVAAMPSGKWAAVVALTVGFGARRSEACKQEPGDFQWVKVPAQTADGATIEIERGFVHVRGRKTRKSNRIIPILGCFVPLVKSALPYLPIGPLNNWDRTFSEACRRAGIDKCSPNDLRRTHATLLGTRGVSNKDIAPLLGHTSVAMAEQVYNQTQASHLAPLVENQLTAAAPIVIKPIGVQKRHSDDDEKKNPLRTPKDSNLRPSDSKSNVSVSENADLRGITDTGVPKCAQACPSVHPKGDKNRTVSGGRPVDADLINPSEKLPPGNGLVPLIGAGGRVLGWEPVTAADVARDLGSPPVVGCSVPPVVGADRYRMRGFERWARRRLGDRLEVAP